MNRRTRTSVLDQPREHAPCLLVSVTCWLLACPLFAGAWVAERDIKIERDAAAQVWPVSSLGPGGDRPFKFIPGASALLSISCEIVNESSYNVEEAADWLGDGIGLLLCEPSRKDSDGFKDGTSFECINQKCNERYPSVHRTQCFVPDLGWRNFNVTGSTDLAIDVGFQINETERSSIVIMSCCSVPSPVGYNCQAKLELVNPNGQHLSGDEFGLPQFYFVLMFFTCGLILLWAANAVYHRSFVNKLHIIISVLVVVRLCESGIDYWRWSVISSTGLEKSWMEGIRFGTISLKWSMYFLFMMCAGFGMGINMSKLIHAKFVVVSFIGLVGSLLVYHFLQHYVLTLTVLIALMSIFSAVRNIRRTSTRMERFLTAERRFFRNHPEATYTTDKTLRDRIKKKMQLMRVVLMYSLAFPLVYIIGSAVTSARFRFELNITVTTQEVTETLFLCGLLWFFRLHDCSQYARVVVDTKTESSSSGAIVVLGAGKRTMFVTMDKDKTGMKKQAKKQVSTQMSTV